MYADLERSPLGTASRLSEPLAGEPVLDRSLRRVLAAGHIDVVVVAAPAGQAQRVRDLVGGAQVHVRTFDGPPHPAAAVVVAARKWSLDSWRGGLGGTCFFDEHTHPGLCLAAAAEFGADRVITVPAEAPLLDPRALDALVVQMRDAGDEAGVVFAQAPPGTVGTVFSTNLLHDAAQAGAAPGWFNAYKPDRPRADLTTTACCWRLPLAVEHTTGRLTSDTRRGFERLCRLLAGGEPQSLDETCARWRALGRAHPEILPREIDL